MTQAGVHTRSACIVGIGARTPLGMDMPSSAAAVRAGICAIGRHPAFVDLDGEPMSVASAPYLSEELAGDRRLHALAHPAIEEALAPLSRLNAPAEPIPVVMGLPERRPGLSDSMLRCPLDPQQWLQTRPVLGQAAVFQNGHSAGLMAMQEGARSIIHDGAEFVLAGGVDSYLEPETLEWLDREGQLMSARNRSGFPPGEGAAFCLMASSDTARRLGLKILARVVSAVTFYEQNCIKTPTICVGKGLSDAVSAAIKALRLPEERVDFTYCDVNGERYRSEELTFTILRTQTAFVDAHLFATPSENWGDLGAASGPAFAGLAIAAARRGYAKGSRALLWTSSEGGERSALILEVLAREERNR